ncbi:chloramphenicol phosphotransferase [Fusarium albosuccineum]|uniref:Chloramphenicol phosphotransferase n=1 Tax=Fusarium albosuccineum TaxID=1237068 RepID=A0A8H4KSM3_9HYPO|nr:chloramphenicol phosphotransferase [Fusarium albosuccineum]
MFYKRERTPDCTTPHTYEMEQVEQVSGGRIVVLNGFPGSGKSTILTQVKELLPAKTTCLLDNHLLIDPVAAVIPERSDEHHELRKIIRAPVFKKLGELAEQGHTVLMTACLGDNNEKDLAFLQEHLDMVRGTIVPMYWINVHCNQTALEKRLVMPERHQGSKSKLTDVGTLRALIRQHRLIEPCKDDEVSARLFVENLDVSGPVFHSVDRVMEMVGFQ